MSYINPYFSTRLLQGLTVVGCCIGSKPVDEKNALKNPLPKRGIKTIHNSNDDGQKKGK